MHRQWLALHLRQKFFRVAFVGLSTSALGTFFISRNRIHADAPDDYHVNFDEGQPPADPLTMYVRDATGGYGFIQGKTGIARFDYMSIPNHSPRWSANSMSSVSLLSGTSWTMFALLEGFHGWDCVEAVTSRLIKDVMESLSALAAQYVPLSAEHAEVGTGMASVRSVNPEQPYPEAVDEVIKKAFLDLDYGIVHQPLNIALASDHPSKAAVSKALSLALTGSSALLSFYDQESRELKVALTGDSRAVLGRRRKAKKNGNNKVSPYEVHVLTTDHTWQNPKELSRLQAQHPDERFPPSNFLDAVPVTRAFGLAAYKWAINLQARLHRDFLGAGPPPNLKSPPYLTAEPEVTTIKIEPGDFLVMASAGLWKTLTNEEVVGLIGLWIDRGMDKVKIDMDSHFAPSYSPNSTRYVGAMTEEVPTLEPKDLPVVSANKDETAMYPLWKTAKKFVCVDNNAAAHVARNALGGADEDLMTALLVMQPPKACKYRDDVNVTVIFFDNHEPRTGEEQHHV